MLQVLLPPSLATGPGSLKSHNGLPVLQPCVQTADIFLSSSPLRRKEEFFPANINIKMALPTPGNGQKALKQFEKVAEISSTNTGKQATSKLVIPSKEKFLPGFREYDAPVGLPESPTESVLSEFPISPSLKQSRTESLPEGLPRSISELHLSTPTTADGSSYVADGFRPRGNSIQNPPSYDTIYGGLGQGSSSTSIVTNEAGPLPTKHLHTVPSVSLFQTPSAPASPSTPASAAAATGPLLYARFPETQNANPRRILLPYKAPSTPGLTHSSCEIQRVQVRAIFSQFFKSIQFSCNDTEKCLVYGYSDSSSMKVPWNIPLERALRQLWKQVMEYDAISGKSKPKSQGKRELATYHAVAMGLTSSDLSSERLCAIWDRSLAFSTPGRRECVQGWLSFTEFVAVVWMVGMAATDPSFI
ncbi:hypothetical protein AA313_de0210326 [Arthrobotrys entomopaga]|nr:hypothetical protein AA313_de0210326 [Arthrobotrys entomopaga]